MDIDENAPGNLSQKGVAGKTDTEAASDPGKGETQVPLPDDADASLDEEMPDVEANNSVSEEHPQP